MNLKPMEKDDKSKSFGEEFVFHALQIRFHLRALEDKTWKIQDLLGNHEYLIQRVAKWNQSISFLEVSLHIISSKCQLSQWLLPPLYFLFPADLQTISRQCSPQGSPVRSWISSLQDQCISLDKVKQDTEAPLTITRQVHEHRLKMIVNHPKEDIHSILSQVWDCVQQNSTASMVESFVEIQKKIKELFATFRESQAKMMIEASQKKKDLESFIQAMITQSLILVKSLQEQKSFIQCNEGKKDIEGLDLVLTWQKAIDCEDHSDEMIGRTEYHIAAVKLKDCQRSTDATEWQTKFEALMSIRCVAWWMKALSPHDKIAFHIVFAICHEKECC